MGEARVRHSGYRSLFWPIVLIGVGLVWLLGNLGVISGANLAVLFRLWPLLLIIIGLDLLFGRQSPLIGALIAVGAVVLLVALMLAGPSLGLAPSLEVVTDTYSEPLDNAGSASVNLSIGAGQSIVRALADSANLLEAEVTHVGEIEFQRQGERERTIHLRQRDQDFSFGQNWLGVFNPERELRWDVGLSPDVPLQLSVSSGAGTSRLDLEGLQLTGLNVSMGAGQLDLRLPAVDDAYSVQVSGGAGEMNIRIAQGAALSLNISGGVGAVNIDLPPNAAVRLDGRSGVGSINVPASFTRVQGDSERDFVGSSGVWESDGFANAERQIIIVYSGGVGGLTVR
jgi:hypothetical protein